VTHTLSSLARDSGRLRSIDGLRAIAALLVIWLHVAQVYRTVGGAMPVGESWLYTIARDVGFGRVGVVVFFLVSGFVIPSGLRHGEPAPIRAFLLKRVWRIYPAYWLSVPLGAFATCWLWGRPFGARDLVINLTLLQDIVGAPSAIGVYWTLLVELVFYALCVVLFLRKSLHDPLRIGVLALVLGIAHAACVFGIWLGLPLSRMPVFLLLHLSLMLCGTLYRQCRLAPAGAPQRRLWFALLVFHLLVFPVAAAWALGLARNYVVADALGIGVFLLGTSWLRIETRLTDWLGRISYSLYLFHAVVFYPLFWWLLHQPVGSWSRSQPLGAYMAVSAVLTIAVAACVYRWVEAPGIRFGRACAQRVRQRASLAAGAERSGFAAARIGPVQEQAPSVT
jgi:peptidoglycan/LPS O-acetylase OafA/YrhL